MLSTTSSDLFLCEKHNSSLACMGGTPVRTKPMPCRQALGIQEELSLQSVLEWYRAQGEDPGYQGKFEEEYCEAFVEFQGGGYADVVATGTVSLFVALLALELPAGSHVLVSPITDPGTLSAIIYAGLKPKLMDATLGNFNIAPAQVFDRITENVSCVLVVHTAGQAVEIDSIVTYCRKKGIKVLEDCSQAHGAKWGGKKVGTFGDIAAFSTMYRKASITGSTGGVVYTLNKDLYHKALAYADRGKPRWQVNFDDRNPNHFLFPALNLHANELGCAIGIASLKRLPETIQNRLYYAQQVSMLLNKHSEVCFTHIVSNDDSPFYCPIFVDISRIRCSKTEFATAVLAEGIGLNPHYQYLVQDWPWIQPYLVDNFACDNARHARDSAFCLYLNENYRESEIIDTIKAILKVEQHFKK